MLDLTIHRFQPSDKEAIMALYKIASIYSEIGYREGPWYQDFDDIEEFYLNGGEFLVGYLDNQIVAIAGLQKINDAEAHVRRIRVHPDYRRKGYGLKILKQLERSAKELGFSILRLRTSTNQKMAQGLYEKNDYIHIPSTTKEYYKEGGGYTFEVMWFQKKI